MAKDSESRFGRQDALTPFRQMADASTRTYRLRAGGRVEFTLPKGSKQPMAYAIMPISTDLGGCAFRISKLDGSYTSYDVQLGGGWDSCTCAGYCWTEKACCHIKALMTLLELGVLAPAPGSAAGDGGGRAA